ncbi:hypothetical protein [Pasteurella langaaensis]|nr:hypothetical protein [Pasteurella langaaensis]
MENLEIKIDNATRKIIRVWHDSMPDFAKMNLFLCGIFLGENFRF